MNKRKAKKQYKKCFIPLIDNFGCLSMSDEELERFNKGIKKYSLQHFSYKYYKDREAALKKATQHPTIYASSGAAIQKTRENKNAGISRVIVFQNIEQLKKEWGETVSGMSISTTSENINTATDECFHDVIVTDPKSEL